MSLKTPYPYVHDSIAINRPVRIPSDLEARKSLALILSRWDWSKANRIAFCPLMEVALEGISGMDVAQAKCGRKAA